VLREIAQAGPSELARRGAVGRQLVQGRLSKAVLCGRFCDVIERGIGEPAPTRSPLPSPASWQPKHPSGRT
jgi:hypothetical protein